MKQLLSIFACTLAVSALARSAPAQCLRWEDGFQVPGVNGTVYALAVHDDGTGRALYVGGTFTLIGDASVHGLAKWDGSTWTAVDPLPTDAGSFAVRALLVVGGDLYVGGAGAGFFGFVSRITATSTTRIGLFASQDEMPGNVTSLAWLDDGNPLTSDLYAGGLFRAVDGTFANSVARWNGTAWSALGSGVGPSDFPEYPKTVEALAAFDDGSGPALYVGGTFTTAGGIAVPGLARWNGAWSSVGTPPFPGSNAFAVFDDGSGDALYSATDTVTRWDGSTWTVVPNAPGPVETFAVFDDGSGTALYAGGRFHTVTGGDAGGIARFDGTSWSELALATKPNVFALAADGESLYVGGNFVGQATAPCVSLARFDGSSFTGLVEGDGFGGHLGYPDVFALLAHDDGTGPALYAGGAFNSAGGAPVRGLVRWNGAEWSSVGGASLGDVYSMAVFDDGGGGGADLYVGGFGDFVGNNAVMKWDGAAWSSIGTLTHSLYVSIVYALAVYDDGSGPALYAAGRFHFGSGSPAPNIAKWNGSQWTTLGAGLNFEAYALAVYDDGLGGGPALYVGGEFTTANNSIAAPRIAKWSSAGWSAVGGGVAGPSASVRALHVFDAGSGRSLYAGGKFASAGGVSAHNVARWNGVAWSPLGAGVTSTQSSDSVVYALTSFDDNTEGGPALYAGGAFDLAGGNPANRVARWNGSAWSALGAGLTDPLTNPEHAYALAAYDDGSGGGADLWAGGRFARAGAFGSGAIAKWSGCDTIGTPYCFGDGSLPTACPCAPPNTVPNPSGAAGHGCANSFELDGARLFASGTTNPDTVRLRGEQQTPIGYSMFIVGTANVPGGIAVADGVRCAGGALVRFGAQNAVGGAIAYPNAALGFTLPLSSVSGVTPGSGATRYYQALYRDAIPGHCSVGTYNFTSATELAW